MTAPSPWTTALLWEDLTRLRALGDDELSPQGAAMLEPHVAELNGDWVGAAAHYRRLRESSRGPWVDWCRTRLVAVSVHLEDPPALEQSIATLQEVESAWPGSWLAVEAAWTMGRLLKARGSADPAAAPRLLSDARVALDRALGQALALLPAQDHWRAQLEREPVGQVWIEVVGVLLRRGRTLPSARDIARAVRLFRSYRRDSDLRAIGRDAEPAPVERGVLRLELVCAPGEPVVIIATADGVERVGFFATGVDELSKAVRRFQSSFYTLDRQHASKDLGWLVEVNRVLLLNRPRLERLLVTAPITWDDSSIASIAEWVARGWETIELVAHGPTALVPWGLLRASPGGPCLGEQVAFRWLPTDLCSEGREGGHPRGVVVEERPRADDSASSLLARLGRGGLVWLRGHGIFDFGDPLASVLSPLGQHGADGLAAHSFLDEVAHQPLVGVRCLFTSVCEAAETHRRGVALDFLSFGYALLAAGARAVVVPTMTITEASDRLVTASIEQLRCTPNLPVASAWRTTVASYLREWRKDPDSGLAERVEAAWYAGMPTPVDIAAFIVLIAVGRESGPHAHLTDP